jgi:hypothetical protein
MNIPLDEWSGSRATRELHETIHEQGKRSDEQHRQVLRVSQWILGLTVILVILTVVMLVVMLAQ